MHLYENMYLSMSLISKLVATITILFGFIDPDLRFVDKAGLNESIINSATQVNQICLRFCNLSFQGIFYPKWQSIFVLYVNKGCVCPFYIA